MLCRLSIPAVCLSSDLYLVPLHLAFQAFLRCHVVQVRITGRQTDKQTGSQTGWLTGQPACICICSGKACLGAVWHDRRQVRVWPEIGSSSCNSSSTAIQMHLITQNKVQEQLMKSLTHRPCAQLAVRTSVERLHFVAVVRASCEFGTSTTRTRTVPQS